MRFPFRPSDAESTLKRKLAYYWSQTAYVLDAETADRLREYLLQAEKYLEDGSLTEAKAAYYRAKRVHILARKDRRVYYSRNVFGMMLTLIFIPIFGIGILGLWLNIEDLNVLRIGPLLAALGGGIGGCTAVLVQVIDVDPESEVVSKKPWYVIKPILGAALGLITYFTVVSGLNIIAAGAQVNNFEGAVTIGFLAGFVESFSIGILTRVATQFTRNGEDD
jgi:hypothetical protein